MKIVRTPAEMIQVCATSRKAYDEACATARKAYEEARATAFASSFLNDNQE